MNVRVPITREVKLLPQALDAVDADGIFEGYASLFGIADLGKDVVMPGAFADSLRKRGASGVRLLWQHDPSEPIGRWLAIEEDRRGLAVRGKLNLAVERAREIHALMREKAVDGLSIGFRVERAGRAADRPAAIGKARPVGDLRRDLSDAAGRAGGEREDVAESRRRDPQGRPAIVPASIAACAQNPFAARRFVQTRNLKWKRRILHDCVH